MKKTIQMGIAFALSLGVSVFTLPAFAGPSGGASHGHGSGPDIGQAGDPANVTRTIEVVMYDNYYEPEELGFKEGETVKFVIKNAGEFVHEFNIATAEMHKAHAPEMMMMMEHGVLEADKINWEAAKDMQAKMGHGMHEEPNSVLLEPGQSAEIVWMFPEHAELEFACNIPGHYDSGMVGEINLTH
jgi:uncharacterized cupredoxin-like copper-binding protein